LRGRETLKRFAQLLIIGVIFFFLFRNLFNNWQQIRYYQWKANYLLLLFSTGIVILNFSFLIKIWLKLLDVLGFNLKYGKGFKIWFISNFGRYIPGKVWQLLGMVYLCEREGIPKTVTTTSAVLAQVFSLVSGVIISIGFLGVDLFERFAGSNMLVLIAIPGLFLLLVLLSVYPRLLEKGMNLLLRKLKKEEVRIRLNVWISLKFLGLYGVSWLIYGFAFLLFIRSFAVVHLQQYFLLTGIFAIAYILGFLSFFAPGGLGIREGILTYLLSFYFPLSLATVVPLVSRIWMTIGEVIGLGISFKMRRIHKERHI